MVIYEKKRKKQREYQMDKAYQMKFNNTYVMDVSQERDLMYIKDTLNVFMNIQVKGLSIIYMKGYGSS